MRKPPATTGGGTPLADAIEAALGDAIEAALGDAIERADADIARLNQLHADILGCKVEELEARLATEKAEQDREKADRKAEAKAQRLPTPQNAPADLAPPARRARGGRGAGAAAPAGASLADGMRRLTARQVELLALVDVDRKTNRVVFTREEHVPDWAALKQAVEAIGGTWRGKTKNVRGGWAFPDEIDAMDAIRCALASGAIFDSKLLGFFPTSAELADAIVARLAIRPGDRVLEPSAGKGAIALAVRRACPGAEVVCVELVPEHQE